MFSTTLIEQNCPFPTTLHYPLLFYIKSSWKICNKALYSFPLVYLFTLVSILYYFNYNNFIQCLDIRKNKSSSCSSFLSQTTVHLKIVFCWLLFTSKMQSFEILVQNGEWFTTVTNLHMYRNGLNSIFHSLTQGTIIKEYKVKYVALNIKSKPLKAFWIGMLGKIMITKSLE